MDLPVGVFAVNTALRLEHVLDQKRHHLSQARGVFLAIAETGDRFACDQWLTVAALDVEQYRRRVTNSCDRLAGCVGVLDQGDGRDIFGKIPQRAMAAGVEHSIKLGAGEVTERSRICQRFHGGGIGLKATSGVGLEVGLVTLRIQRWQAAFWRCQSQLRTGIEEGVVRRGKLFKPEAGLFARVAQLVVGG